MAKKASGADSKSVQDATSEAERKSHVVCDVSQSSQATVQYAEVGGAHPGAIQAA